MGPASRSRLSISFRSGTVDSEQLASAIDATDNYVMMTTMARSKFINAGWTIKGAEMMTVQMMKMAVPR